MKEKQCSAKTVYSGRRELLTSTADIVRWWKEYFGVLFNPTYLPSIITWQLERGVLVWQTGMVVPLFIKEDRRAFRLSETDTAQAPWEKPIPRFISGLPQEVFRASPAGGETPGKTQDSLEWLSLSWEGLEIHPERLEGVSGERDLSGSLLRMLSLDSRTRYVGEESMVSYLCIWNAFICKSPSPVNQD